MLCQIRSNSSPHHDRNVCPNIQTVYFSDSIENLLCFHWGVVVGKSIHNVLPVYRVHMRCYSKSLIYVYVDAIASSIVNMVKFESRKVVEIFNKIQAASPVCVSRLRFKLYEMFSYPILTLGLWRHLKPSRS